MGILEVAKMKTENEENETDIEDYPECRICGEIVYPGDKDRYTCAHKDCVDNGKRYRIRDAFNGHLYPKIYHTKHQAIEGAGVIRRKLHKIPGTQNDEFNFEIEEVD